MKRPWMALVVGTVLLATGCGGDAGGSSMAISGSVMLLDPANFGRLGASCRGTGTFSGVREGAVVTAEGGATTLATGSITGEGNCRFRFETALPKKGGPPRYEFQVDGMPSLTGIVNTQNPIE